MASKKKAKAARKRPAAKTAKRKSKAAGKKAGGPARSRAVKKTARKPAKKTAKKKTGTAKAKARSKTVKKAPARKKTPARKKKQTVGEGDYEASRAFLKDQAGFVQKNRAKIPNLGRQAEAALDGPEGDALREAEAVGQARSRDTF